MSERPTMPIAGWDIPDPSGVNWDQAPSEETIAALQKTVEKPAGQAKRSVLSTPASALIGRVFMGRLNVSDLDYMAKAILQMCDENHELRERVRRLEERLDGK